MSSRTPEDKPATFTRLLRALMRPLVRAMIAQGVTAPAFYRILKGLYVEVADQHFRLDGERPTDSRISILTGVHRRDVRMLRTDDAAAQSAADEKVTTFASVIGRWLASAATTDKAGQPIALPRTADADDASFDALVRSISKDIRPKTVLDELNRQGLIVVNADTGLIELQMQAVLGPGDAEQKVHFFAENVGDHIDAAVDNLLSEDPKYLERAVFYNRLRSASVDAIEIEARRLGGDALISLNRMAHDYQMQDSSAPDGTERFRFGIFFYREDEDDADGSTDTDQRRGNDIDE